MIDTIWSIAQAASHHCINGTRCLEFLKGKCTHNHYSPMIKNELLTNGSMWRLLCLFFFVRYCTDEMTDVWHNIICKTFSWKKKTIYWYSSKHLKIELNWVTSYKYTIQGVTLRILIPQLLKFWNFEFQTDGPQFFSKINKYATKKCQYQSIIIYIQLGW
jgi:hypothetical protein